MPQSMPKDPPRQRAGFQDLLGELRGKVDSRTYAALVDVFRVYQGARVRVPVAPTRDERIDHARHLLMSGLGRGVTSDRMVARFTISKRQAQRDISAALALGPLGKP